MIALHDLRLGDLLVVDLHAVGRLQVEHPPLAAASLEPCVSARHRGVVENEVVSLRAPNVERVAVEVENARDAEVHVVKLELIHQVA